MPFQSNWRLRSPRKYCGNTAVSRIEAGQSQQCMRATQQRSLDLSLTCANIARTVCGKSRKPPLCAKILEALAR